MISAQLPCQSPFTVSITSSSFNSTCVFWIVLGLLLKFLWNILSLFLNTEMPESVSMPQPSQPMVMVEGGKHRVKCDVTNVAPARHLSVLFHKGNKIVSTYAFSDSSPEPVNVSSVYNLIAHRDDNGARIWCEAKLNFLTTGPQNTSMLSESQQVIVLCEFFAPSQIIWRVLPLSECIL